MSGNIVSVDESRAGPQPAHSICERFSTVPEKDRREARIKVETVSAVGRGGPNTSRRGTRTRPCWTGWKTSEFPITTIEASFSTPTVPSSAALLIKLLNSSCSRCSIFSDHSNHFLLHINSSHRFPRRRRHVRAGRDMAGGLILLRSENERALQREEGRGLDGLVD